MEIIKMSKKWEGPMLTEDEVCNRIKIAMKNPLIINELYDSGKLFLKNLQDRIQRVESKATYFAAYGTAIVTFLVSNWLSFGISESRIAPWIASLAGICGFLCAMFSICALTLWGYEYPSQDDWLNKDEIRGPIEHLKGFRIITLWSEIKSKEESQKHKAEFAICAQKWLGLSAFYLLTLLINLAYVYTFRANTWIRVFWSRIETTNAFVFCEWSRTINDAAFLIPLFLILACFLWESRVMLCFLIRSIVGSHGNHSRE
jgi:hypothetical protein